MESVNVEMPAAAGGTPATARWNPTKEQISMLEGLYGQGIRTPSAEQIHEITNRLKAYGHIEGKNVFYWFQNHKARQRQKQKDQHHLLHYFNGYLHKASPLFHPHPTTNVVCNPYYIAQRDQVGFSPNYPNLPVPGGIKKRPRPQKVSPVHEPAGAESSVMHDRGDNSGQLNQQKTILPLFPLHPTGILEERSSITSNPYISSSSSTTSAGDSITTAITTPSSSCDTNEQDHTFFDFF